MENCYYGAEYGVKPAVNLDRSEVLTQFFNCAKENACLVLPAGDYYLEDCLALENLKNVRICGYGARLIVHFDQSDPYSFKGCFVVRGCEDLTLEGFSITTDNPANTPGRVLHIDTEAKTLDILLESGFALTGKERIFALDSFDDGRNGPNWHVFCADDNGQKGKGNPYKRIADNVIRFSYWPSTEPQMRRLQMGERICMRHSLYPTTQMRFRDCQRVLVQNVTVDSSPGLCCEVAIRCADFTFRNLTICPPTGSKKIYASNADGIHVKGLGGKLLLEGCRFENLGDDALNVHTTGGMVASVSGHTAHCTLAPRLGQVGLPLEDNWAIAGDEVAVYDGDFVKKGTIQVVGYENGLLQFQNETCQICAGDMLANNAFCPDVAVRNCTVRGTRARGMIFQTHHVVLDGCYFADTALQAVEITSDMVKWSEMGPSEDVRITNNVFDHTGIGDMVMRCAGVGVSTNHEGRCEDVMPRKPVHKSIHIENNKFIGLSDAAICVDAVEKMTVLHNEMFGCKITEQNRHKDYCNHAMLFNCENVSYLDNTYIGCEGKECLQK